MKTKQTKIIMLALIIITLIITTSLSAFALDDSMPPIEGNAKNLKIEFYVEKNGEPISIPGAEIGIYRVSDIKVQGGSAEYIVLDKYSQLRTLEDGRDVTFNGITVSQSQELAQEFAKLVTTPDFTGVTNTEGECEFSDLEQGMYLVKEEAATLDAEKYEKFAPYLVSVPLAQKSDDGNSWMYTVVSEPKTTVSELPTEPVTEPGTEPTTEISTQPPTAQNPTISSKSTDDQTHNILGSIKTGKVLMIAIPLLIILGLAITLIKLRERKVKKK